MATGKATSVRIPSKTGAQRSAQVLAAFKSIEFNRTTSGETNDEPYRQQPNKFSRTSNDIINTQWTMIHQMDANIQKLQETKKANPKWPQKCGKTVYYRKEIQYLGYAISNFTWVRVWVGQKGWLLGFRPTDWHPSLAVKQKIWAKWTHAHTEMDFWDGFPKSQPSWMESMESLQSLQISTCWTELHASSAFCMAGHACGMGVHQQTTNTLEDD